MTYTPKTFNLPKLEGISEEQLKVHLALYEGYVKHVNLIWEIVKQYGKTDDEGGKYALAEVRRRFSFEFNGMRMHEHYFEQFEGSPMPITADGALAKSAEEKYGSVEGFIEHIKTMAGTRGIGWVVVYFDPIGKILTTVFVNDHELGQLAGLPIILALDLWEHAYMVDYKPSEKKTYIDAFLANINWSVPEKRFDEAK